MKGDAAMAASKEEIESYYVGEKIQQGSGEEGPKSSSTGKKDALNERWPLVCGLVVAGVLGGIFLAMTSQPGTTINVTANSSTTASDTSGESDEAELYLKYVRNCDNCMSVQIR